MGTLDAVMSSRYYSVCFFRAKPGGGGPSADPGGRAETIFSAIKTKALDLLPLRLPLAQ